MLTHVFCSFCIDRGIYSLVHVLHLHNIVCTVFVFECLFTFFGSVTKFKLTRPSYRASGFYSSGTIFKALVTLTMYAIGAAHFGTSLAKFAVGDSVSYTTFLVRENSLMFLPVINVCYP